MKANLIVNAILILLLVACLGWTAALDLRITDIQGQLAQLAEMAGEYERLNAQIRDIRLDVQRAEDLDREAMDARMTDLEERMERKLRRMEDLAENLSPAETDGEKRKSGSSKDELSAEMLKGIPRLDDALVQQGLEHLSPILGLDQEQKDKVREIVGKHVEEINDILSDVQSGKLDQEEALEDVEDTLEEVTEELEPVLDDAQMAIFQQLILTLKDQAGEFM